MATKRYTKYRIEYWDRQSGQLLDQRRGLTRSCAEVNAIHYTQRRNDIYAVVYDTRGQRHSVWADGVDCLARAIEWYDRDPNSFLRKLRDILEPKKASWIKEGF